MASPFDDPATEFRVLRNAAGEYSLWPTFRENPAGWVTVGPTGSREVCSRWVDDHASSLFPGSIQMPITPADSAAQQRCSADD